MSSGTLLQMRKGYKHSNRVNPCTKETNREKEEPRVGSTQTQIEKNEPWSSQWQIQKQEREQWQGPIAKVGGWSQRGP